MAAAKLCCSGTMGAVKSDQGNDSLDTFIRQAIGKEPLIPFTRAADGSMQWMQLLNALDQPDLPGWPLITPVKPQMQKCEKCSQEFCSPINYRRHTRVHRRSLNVNKDFHRNRDMLAAFWDKISLEQAKRVVSFDDVMLKDISGSSIIRALASSVCKPGIWTLPHIYVKAGTNLLDIIQAKHLGQPLSSGELFGILDDASEKTFLCAGTAESVQKYVFDEETARNCLELKNLVACTSFFLELQLVKAWIAHKDAEALRCQKLLVEEEEAAQKRRAALLEKKKQKKLRQKAKEQPNRLDSNVDVDIDVVDGPPAAESSTPSSPSDIVSNSSPDSPANQDSSLESTQPQTEEPNEKCGEQQFVDNRQHDDHTRRSSTNCWQTPKYLRGSRFRFHPQPQKSEPMLNLVPSRDRGLQNGTKIWTKKLKFNTDVEKENSNPQAAQEENKYEVIIGSIPVTLKTSVVQQQKDNIVFDKSHGEQAVLPTKENLTKSNHVPPETNLSGPRHWRPVRHGEVKNLPSLSGEVDTSRKVLSGERSEQSYPVDSNFESGKTMYNEVPDENYTPQGSLPFSSAAAKEFLAQRWKEAISADHVTLVLSQPKSSGPSDVQPEPSTI